MGEEPAQVRMEEDESADLKALCQRLESLRIRLDRGGEADSREEQHILRERARLLAREDESVRKDAETLHVVEFLLSGERYAVELSAVREVYPMKEFTPLPCTPSFVIGLINIRGQVLSIIDIRRFFELPERGLSNLNRVVVLHGEMMEFGILADAILGVRCIASEELQLSLPTLNGIRSDYFKGVAGDRLIVLDAMKIVADKRLVVHEEVEE